MGKKNQIFGRYIRILQSAENPNEIYIVLEKDKPMEAKYIRQFDNMFAGKDVIITITELKRGLSKKQLVEDALWSIEPL